MYSPIVAIIVAPLIYQWNRHAGCYQNWRRVYIKRQNLPIEILDMRLHVYRLVLRLAKHYGVTTFYL